MATNTNIEGEGYSSGEEYLMMDPVGMQNVNAPSPAVNKESPHVQSLKNVPQGSSNTDPDYEIPFSSPPSGVPSDSVQGDKNHPQVAKSRSSPISVKGGPKKDVRSSSLPVSTTVTITSKPTSQQKARKRALSKSKSSSPSGHGIKKTFKNLKLKIQGGVPASSSSPADLPKLSPKPVPKPRTNVTRSASESATGTISLEELPPDFELEEQYGEMTAEEIAVKFGESLPLQLYVAKGTYGTDESYSLSSDQRCNIHFLQHREVVKIEDTANNAEFAIPINSCIKFAPIYNHRDETRGHLYPHVSDILEADPLPRLIFACQLRDDDGKNQRELLVVKEVIPAEDEEGLRKIRFFSITKQVEKVLDENVYGHFSTRPTCLLLYIEDLLRYIPDPFPMTVGIFHDTSRKVISCGLPPYVFRRGLLLSKRYTDVSFVATSVLEGIEDVRNAQPFEIPTDIDVDFKLVKLAPSEKEQLRKDTEILRKTLNADSVKHYRYANLTKELYKLQTTFYRAVRSKETTDKFTVDDDDETDFRDYSNPRTTNRLKMDHRVQMLETSVSRCQDTLRTLQPSYEQLMETNEQLTDRVTELEKKLSTQVLLFEAEINGLRAELQDLRSSHDAGECNLKAGASPLRHKSKSESSVHTTNPLSEDVNTRNKELLASMDVSQIQFLLDALVLSQYKEIFAEEGISGDILVECDDNVLEQDLGIRSRIHRIKLLTLISGKTSVEMYL